MKHSDTRFLQNFSTKLHNNVYRKHGDKKRQHATTTTSCILGSFTLHFGLKYEMIYQLGAIEYLFASFSSTCFVLIRPSSGVMDVTISLHMQHMVFLV